MRRGRPDLRNRKCGRFRLRNVSRLDPTLFPGRVFGVLFRSRACGCRFGSGSGRFWVGVCRPLALFRFGGVQLKEEKGTDPKNRQ